MSKPNIKLGFSDTFNNCKLFFIDVLSRRFNVTLDDVNPDYLIFGDSNFGHSHFNYPEHVTKIFYTGENVRPNYFTYDHAITFDFENSPRHYRLPLYVMEMWAVVHDDGFTNDFLYLEGLHNRVDWEKEFDSKTETVSYIQSNPNCNVRTEFVQNLQMKMQVNCAGPHLNNMKLVPRNRLAKMDFLKKHKLNIAFENGSYPGYVTEKILDAFYSNTLPLYWGSPNVCRDFNTKSFYNISNPNRIGILDEIKEIIGNRKVWCDIMSQPRFNHVVQNEYMELNGFLDWFCTNVYKG